MLIAILIDSEMTYSLGLQNHLTLYMLTVLDCFYATQKSLQE